MQPYKDYEGGYNRTVQEFGGLNERLRCNDNEFARMENVSLQEYPVMTVRNKRLTLDEVKEKDGNAVTLIGIGFHGKHIKILREPNARGIYECNLYADGMKHSLSSEHISATAYDVLAKTLIGMGANVVVLPDKVSFNIHNSSVLGYYEYEELENIFETAMVSLEPCTLSGEVYNAKTVGKTAPASPANGDVWVDTSKETSAYKVWDESTKQWVGVATTYIKLSAPGIGVGFKKWDSVDMRLTSSLTNMSVYKYDKEELFAGDTLKRLQEQLHLLINIASWEEKRVILFDVQEDYLIISGLLDQPCRISFRIERKMFESSFYFEHNNRLWGCVYEDGANEIRASKQGDCCNWDSYLGVSTDSYAVTVGIPGEFTGGISFGGYPLFFKENCIIKVYGNLPSNYQLITTPCMGVEKGMEKSLVIANGVLFYKAPGCFCAYDGSMPVNISKKIKNVTYKDIQAGATDERVYFACTEESGERYILVFDIEAGTWTKESCGEILSFVRDSKGLSFVEREDGHRWGVTLKSIDGNFDEMSISDAELYPKEENDVSWYFESGDIGLSDINLKYIKKLLFRAKVYAGSFYKVYVSCDEGPFVQFGEKMLSPGIRTLAIPLSLERCEKFRYRVEGSGRVDFYSIDYEIKEGSDKR